MAPAQHRGVRVRTRVKGEEKGQGKTLKQDSGKNFFKDDTEHFFARFRKAPLLVCVASRRRSLWDQHLPPVP